MNVVESKVASDEQQKIRSLSRWESEGGAPEDAAQQGVHCTSERLSPKMIEAEFVNLHVRIIALENLVISLLATATDHQVQLAREMAAYISPREGFTPHIMTTRAAGDMIGLIERAAHFRTDSLGEAARPSVDP